MTEDMIPRYKICIECNMLKHIDSFYKCKSTSDKHESKCIECRQKHNRERYIENREHVLENQHKYRAEHREELNQRTRDKRKSEDEKQKLKDYNRRNKDRIAKRDKVYAQKNREKIAKHKHNYWIQNKDRLGEYRKVYNTRNATKLKLAYVKKSALSKGLGYNPINNVFEGSHYHHLFLDIGGIKDTSIGVFIPGELHTSIMHNSKTGAGMKDINKASFLWLAEQAII